MVLVVQLFKDAFELLSKQVLELLKVLEGTLSSFRGILSKDIYLIVFLAYLLFFH